MLVGRRSGESANSVWRVRGKIGSIAKDNLSGGGGQMSPTKSGGDRLFAAVVTQDLQTLAVLEAGTQQDLACFPYIPGLFSFREIPPLARALAKLAHAPDLLICDGHGLAHPRRFGLACHLGVLFDIPTIGCAKSCLIGQFDSPGDHRGDCLDARG